VPKQRETSTKLHSSLLLQSRHDSLVSHRAEFKLIFIFASLFQVEQGKERKRKRERDRGREPHITETRRIGLNGKLEYCSDSYPALCNSIKIRYVSMFLLSALFHTMFRPNWPSSGVRGVFKESALFSF
jgi:hypothetical protein